MYPIYMLQLTLSPKCNFILLYRQPFPVTGHFEKRAPKDDPKMTFNAYRSNVPHIDITTIPEAQIHSVSFYD